MARRSVVNPAHLLFSALFSPVAPTVRLKKARTLTPSRPVTSETTVLPDEAFARPWVFIDRLKFDQPFDALLATPLGFVAISHAPTPDGRAMPPINNIVALSRDGLTWEENTLGATIHGRALAWATASWSRWADTVGPPHRRARSSSAATESSGSWWRPRRRA